MRFKEKMLNPGRRKPTGNEAMQLQEKILFGVVIEPQAVPGEMQVGQQEEFLHRKGC